MTRRTLTASTFLALLLACLPVVPVGSHARAQSSTVRIPLIITNESENAIDDLKQEEIKVFEDGKELPLISLKKVATPTKYTIAIDRSGSFKTILPDALNAASFLIDQNRPEDMTAVVTFVGRDQVNLVQDFTSDKAVLLKSLRQTRVELGQTVVIDAIYVTLEALSKSTSDNQTRKVLVLISDGEDRNSVYTPEDLSRLLRRTNVQVFVIGIVRHLDDVAGFVRKSPLQKAQKLLTDVAQHSGDESFSPRSPRKSKKLPMRLPRIYDGNSLSRSCRFARNRDSIT